MKKPAKTKAFATEVELCAAFLAAIDQKVWTAYPESCGWDILLVRKADGFQIGVQAKLRLNSHVISQSLEDGGWSYVIDRPGPDCRAVLVPSGDSGGFGAICDYIGITIISMSTSKSYWNTGFNPALPSETYTSYNGHWHEWAPTKRHTLPEYIPDVPAGASGPIQLTRWKIGAIKLAIVLERRGFLTRADFKHLGIDFRRWPDQGWLKVDNGRFVSGPSMPNFKAQHPRNYVEIEADAKKWMPPEPVELFQAKSML